MRDWKVDDERWDYWKTHKLRSVPLWSDEHNLIPMSMLKVIVYLGNVLESCDMFRTATNASSAGDQWTWLEWIGKKGQMK